MTAGTCATCDEIWVSGDICQTCAPPPQSIDRAERRILTLCFVDIVSSTEMAERLGLDDYDDALQSFHQAAGQVVDRFRGRVIQHFGDGMLACFGLDDSAEDAALASLGCGLAMVAEVSERLSLCQIRVGLHMGPVLCRAPMPGVEMPQLTGLNLNLAARIQAEARPSTVLVSDQVACFIRRLAWLDIAESRVVELKGTSTPVTLHEIRRFVVTRPEPSTVRLFEREDILSDCLQDDRGALLLVGPSGIGKTALVQSVMAFNASAGRTIVLTPRSNLIRSPLMPITEWLGTFLPEDPDPLHRLETLALGLDAAEIEGLAEILEPERLSTPHPERSFRSRRESRLEAAVAVLSYQMSQQSALLVFDDFQWSDVDSREVIERLLQSGAPTASRILLLSRPNPEVSAFAARTGVRQRNVPPLSNAACHQLLRDEVPQGFAEPVLIRLSEASGGNPLFLRVLARAEALRPSGSGAVLPPPTIEATIQYLLEELGSLKEVVLSAAVIGCRFMVQHLQHLVEPDFDLDAALNRLVSLGVFVVEPGHFGFQHILLRDCAYFMLSLRRRRNLHGQLARALILHDPAFCTAYPELIADHFVNAKAMEEAVVPSVAAGMKFLGCASFEQAASYLEQAVATLVCQEETDNVASDLLIRAQTLLGATQVQRFGFSHPEVERTYQELEARVNRHNAGRLERLHALYGLFAHRIIGGKVRSSKEVLARMAAVADPDAPEQQLLVLVNRSAHRLYSGDFVSARAANRQIFDLYDPALHGRMFLDLGADPLVSALTAECHIEAVTGKMDDARRTRDRALGQIDRIGARMQLPWVHVFAAQSFYYGGADQEAQASIDLGLQLADAQGSAFWSLVGRLWQGVFAVGRGDAEQGETILSRLIPAAAEIGINLGWPVFTAALAQALLQRSEKDEAQALSLAAIRRIAQDGELIWAAPVRALRQQALLAH